MSQTPLPKTSQPAKRALETINVFTLEQLAKHTEKEIANLHGMGPKGIRILKAAMAELNLSFASETK